MIRSTIQKQVLNELNLTERGKRSLDKFMSDLNSQDSITDKTDIIIEKILILNAFRLWSCPKCDLKLEDHQEIEKKLIELNNEL